MSWFPIALINPQYENFNNQWLKFYTPGTTNPLAMATDETGGTQLAKAQLNNAGFITTDGTTIFIPYVQVAYDAYMFPTEAEADANATTNAVRFADNINPSGLSGTTKQDKTLISGQISVVFPSLDVNVAAFYLFSDDADQGRLYNPKDYSVTGANTITLTNSYPEGSVIRGIQDTPDSTSESRIVTEIDLTSNLIITSTGVSSGDIYETMGYTTKSDGGQARWIATGATIAVSQSPSDLGVAKLSDLDGNEFALSTLNATAREEFNLMALGSAGDGATDDTLPVFAGLESARLVNGAVLLGSKYFSLTTAYTWTSGRFDLVGNGSRDCGFIINHAGIGFNMNRNDTFFTGGLNWRGFSIVDGGTSIGGLFATFLNYSAFDDILIDGFSGEGLNFSDVQDININNVNVFRCGSVANSKPAAIIGNPSTGNENVNSVKSYDFHVEDFEFEGLRLHKLKNSQFFGPKLHGHKTVLTQSTSLIFKQCVGVEMFGLQAAFTRGTAIDIDASASTDVVTIIGGEVDAVLATTILSGNLQTVQVNGGTNKILGVNFRDSTHINYTGDIGFYIGNSFGEYNNTHELATAALISGDTFGKLAGAGGNISEYGNKMTRFTSGAPFLIEVDLQAGAELMRIGNGIVDVSDEYRVDGKKVLDARQPAIADSVGGDFQAKINEILAMMRVAGHGFIET